MMLFFQWGASGRKRSNRQESKLQFGLGGPHLRAAAADRGAPWPSSPRHRSLLAAHITLDALDLPTPILAFDGLVIPG